MMVPQPESRMSKSEGMPKSQVLPESSGVFVLVIGVGGARLIAGAERVRYA